MNETPASLGYRMPGDWEPHDATWLSWPNFSGISFSSHQDHDHLEDIYVQIVRALLDGEDIWINTTGPEATGRIKRHFNPDEIERLRFFEIPTREPWLRDYGGSLVISTREENPIAMINWEFNAWGERYLPSDPENQVPSRLAALCGIPHFDPGVILEGGSFEVNGRGTLLATESCVLNPNRNPDWDKAAAEKLLSEILEIHHFIWLKQGLAWDDLDGHIDSVARFAANDLIVAATEENPQDDNFAPLQANLETLGKSTDENGRPVKVVTIPMPKAIHYLEFRVPASYLNFYVGNRVVLLPAFGDPNDPVACERLQEIYPDRQVIPIDCSQVIRDFGALHCMLMGIPDAS